MTCLTYDRTPSYAHWILLAGTIIIYRQLWSRDSVSFNDPTLHARIFIAGSNCFFVLKCSKNILATPLQNIHCIMQKNSSESNQTTGQLSKSQNRVILWLFKNETDNTNVTSCRYKNSCLSFRGKNKIHHLVIFDVQLESRRKRKTVRRVIFVLRQRPGSVELKLRIRMDRQNETIYREAEYWFCFTTRRTNLIFLAAWSLWFLEWASYPFFIIRELFPALKLLPVHVWEMRKYV